MANPEHVEILNQGVEVWNKWREGNLKVNVDLREANLGGADLSRANLGGADLSRANLRGANLDEANLCEANLSVADLAGANLGGADLSRADLAAANLQIADLREANLREVRLGLTIFANVKLSTVKGLDTCVHDRPSSLDTHTLILSQNFPEVFLRGCGLADWEIEAIKLYDPTLTNDQIIDIQQSIFNIRSKGSPIQFYSCFISHSTKDHLFAEQLFNDLQGKGVRTWYAPEEMKGGEKLYDQIDSAIRLHDKLLLVLSEQSLQSEYVMTEIRRCRKAEKREGKRKLFPIRLVDMKTIQDWECFDADSGKDLAVEVREFFLPDFSNWKDRNAYQKAFDLLLRDLQESAEQEISSA